MTIDRPEVMNSFTGDTLTEKRRAVEDAPADGDAGVIAVTDARDPCAVSSYAR